MPQSTSLPRGASGPRRSRAGSGRPSCRPSPWVWAVVPPLGRPCRPVSSPGRVASAATTKTRSRRWGAPTSDARTHVQDPMYPSAARSEVTRSSPRTRRAAAFSNTTTRGRTTRMASAMSNHNPLRFPSFIPARLPALLMSWHGHPAVSTSTGSTAAQSVARMSPWLGTSGQWWASTREASGSASACHATRPPNTSRAAMSSPPMPVHMDPMVITRRAGASAS